MDDGEEVVGDFDPPPSVHEMGTECVAQLLESGNGTILQP